MTDSIVMGGVFYFMGDSTMIDKALNITEIVAAAVGTGHSTSSAVLSKVCIPHNLPFIIFG